MNIRKYLYGRFDYYEVEKLDAPTTKNFQEIRFIDAAEEKIAMETIQEICKLPSSATKRMNGLVYRMMDRPTLNTIENSEDTQQLLELVEANDPHCGETNTYLTVALRGKTHV